MTHLLHGAYAYMLARVTAGDTWARVHTGSCDSVWKPGYAKVWGMAHALIYHPKTSREITSCVCSSVLTRCTQEYARAVLNLTAAKN
jgi:hypothetical protein